MIDKELDLSSTAVCSAFLSVLVRNRDCIRHLLTVGSRGCGMTLDVR